MIIRELITTISVEIYQPNGDTRPGRVSPNIH